MRTPYPIQLTAPLCCVARSGWTDKGVSEAPRNHRPPWVPETTFLPHHREPDGSSHTVNHLHSRPFAEGGRSPFLFYFHISPTAPSPDLFPRQGWPLPLGEGAIPAL